jgi:hypothetical protein
LVIVQRSALKGSIKPTGQTLGTLFGLGSDAITITYGKLVPLLISRRCIAEADSLPRYPGTIVITF